MIPEDMALRPIGRITAGIQLNTLIEQTVSLLDQRLPVWRDHPGRDKAEEAEDRLSSDLCKFLNLNSSMIHFNFQEPQPGNRSVDFSVTPAKEEMYIDAELYAYNRPFLLIEAKRLPAPPPADRKHEYVTGIDKQSGGIQRFKLGLHGAGHKEAVIIGYIQQGSCREWQHTINTWIADLVSGQLRDGCSWQEGEDLRRFAEDEEHGAARCESLHPRNDDTESVLIYHLWIDMNREARAQ
jgi:hypothetical protein